MPSQITLPASFAITGHHRSGTSLVAAMLQSAGLAIGERLMGAAESNKYGHFEDLDFYEFHLNVLRAQGFHETGYILEPSVSVPDQLAHAARSLVQQRMGTGRAWGWKEPRTTLFLDFWQQLIPQLHYIFLFRAPWEVVDSLFRRGDVNYLKNPNMTVRVWLNYNRALLAFHHRHPERCLLVESYAVGREPSRLLEAIARKFGHHFGPIAEVFDEQIYLHHESQQHRAILGHWFAEAVELYEELRGKADVIVPQEVQPRPAGGEDWALQHWVDWRGAQRQLKQCKGALEQLQTAASQPCAACQRTSAELHALRTQAKQFSDELAEVRQQADFQLYEARSQAEQLRNDLERTRQQADVQLHEARSQAEQFRNNLERARQQADAQLHEARLHAEQLRNDLSHARQQSQQTRAAHQQGEAELRHVHTEVERLRYELEQSRQKAQYAHSLIAAMESTRFWKLRRLWQRLKHPFGGHVRSAN